MVSDLSVGVAISDSGCASGTVTNTELVKNAMSLFAFFIALTLKRLKNAGGGFSVALMNKLKYLIQPEQRSFLLLLLPFLPFGLHVQPSWLPFQPCGLHVRLSKLLHVLRAELRVQLS